MKNFLLKAEIRQEVGKKANLVRQAGNIPAVLYGHGAKNLNLSVKKSDLKKIYSQAGESSLVDLDIDGDKTVKVLINDIQEDPITSDYIHVDLHVVNMAEKITTNIELKFVGETAAVKEYGGILLTQMDELEVTCLPQDLVSEIVVDISVLKQLDEAIHVKDIKLSEKIKIENNPDDVVISVVPPRTDKELEDLEEKPELDVSQVEVAAEKKEATDEEVEKKD